MAAPDPTSSALFGGIQVTDALKSMTEGPRLADAGAVEHRMARLTERWIEFQTASRTYEGVVAAAWITANRTFAGRMQERFNAGESMQPDDALKLWLDTANETLLETQRSAVVPRVAATAAALRDGLPARAARGRRERRRARGPPHADRDRRGPSLDPRAQAPAAAARAGARADDPAAHGRPGGDARRGGSAEPADRLRNAAAGGDQGRRGRDRDDAEGRDVPHRQGDALSLPAAGRATGGDPGADRLQPDRPPHDDRPPGGPFAGPQPPRSGHRPVGRRLGECEPRRSLADHRRLRVGLPRRLRPRDARGDRRREGQSARHLRGRGLRRRLRGPQPRPCQERRAHRDPARLPCGPRVAGSSTSGRAASPRRTSTA